MNIEKKYLHLFADCIPVKGVYRSVIYDTVKQEYKFIPNSLYEIITKHRGKTINEIKNIYKNKFNDIIDGYFEFLLTKEYAFLCEDKDELKRFPKIDLYWDYPAKISNCVIDINETSIHNFQNIFKELEILGCKHIQLRFFSEYNLKKLSEILDLLQKSSITIVEIFIKDSKEYTFEDINDICIRNPRVKSIVVYDSINDKIASEGYYNLGIILYIKQNIISEKNCGNIHHTYFNSNIFLISESQHYNTCLNRKLCIDKEGNIKNCSSMKRSFGNIKKTTLVDATQKEGFKDLWGIRKDDIDVCKDCEFRYMCTDCRCFIKDPTDIYSQPARCGYNPYIAKWESEEGFIAVDQWKAENPNWEKKVKRMPLVKNPQPVE